MKHWEYFVAYLSPEHEGPTSIQGRLDGYGSEGWELVAISNYAMYFKRPKQYNCT